MQTRKVNDVVYFSAVMYNPEMIEDADKILSDLFGNIVLKSEVFDFSFTDYYSSEMGCKLVKYFVAFDVMQTPQKLPEYKLMAVNKEQQYSINNNRIINIDPGYMAKEKIVVASTKNFTHRIFIGSGIYGDLQLMRQKGSFRPLGWTYEDYKSKQAASFFKKLYEIFDMAHLR